MTRLLAALLLLLLALALCGPGAGVVSATEAANHHTVKWTGPKAGHSLYYNDGPMFDVGDIRVRQGYIKRVLRNKAVRTLDGDRLPKEVDGYTAVTDCSKIGWIAYISLNGGKVERYQILDCSQPYHAKAHVKARRVAEVDKSSFVRNGCNPKRGRCPAQLVDIRRY